MKWHTLEGGMRRTLAKILATTVGATLVTYLIAGAVFLLVEDRYIQPANYSELQVENVEVLARDKSTVLLNASAAPLLDAANIDLKGFSDAFYDACGAVPGSLSCVRATIERLAADPACHLEVTTLVVPGMNDGDDEMDELSCWLSSLDGGHGRETVAHHVTRFFPCWRLTDRGPTPVSTVRRLADVSRRHLAHVYVGNC